MKYERTAWKCERCGLAGTVQYEKHAGVYEVVHLVEDAHNAESRGICSLELNSVRVWRVDLPDLEQLKPEPR